ncbi:MAG TPA: hypothetical protein VGD55_10945, partial [Acidothermaceae bacterium]
MTSTNIDVFGNAYQSIDSGCIGGCARVDPVLTRYAQPAEVSGSTGWLWQNIDTYTSGTGDIPASTPRNRTEQTYDPEGSPLATSRVIQGSLPLARSNPGGGGVAPAPPTASTDRTALLVTHAYDTFGNPITTVAAGGRCRATSYDASYAALPVNDTVDVGTVPSGGSCGGTALVSSAAYDRGLGTITTLTDMRGETTNVQFDGLGRIAALFRPDPATGIASAVPSMTLAYQLPSGPTTPYTLVHTEVQDGTTPTAQSYRESWTYVDGLGRTFVTLNQADPASGDAGPWVVSGLTTFDGKGAPKLKYLDYFYSGDPTQFVASGSVGSAYSQQTYDAFGRDLYTYALDRTAALANVYHALSVDAWDAADMTPTSGHYGTFATTQSDGHGRTIAVTERAYTGKSPQAYVTTTAYESTGEPVLITRSSTSLPAAASVSRWMRYDSIGRMVANVEPDTTVGYVADPAASVPAQTWRYAYDDEGDLVGTSDARGCGANFTYDTGGRIASEDYSPCAATQPAYSTAPEVTYLYDAPDPAVTTGINGFAVTAGWYRGRLASTADRAGKTIVRYDGRGRTTGVARQLVSPAGAVAPRWYVQESTFDADDRLTVEQTGAVDSGAALSITTQTTTTFSKRSLTKSVVSNQWTVVASVAHAADKKPLQVVYGDAAGTTSLMSYDARRRLSSVQTYRGPPAIWSSPPQTYVPPPSYAGPPSTFQLLLQDLAYTYDSVGNPLAIQDSRTPSEWPSGAQPVS